MKHPESRYSLQHTCSHVTFTAMNSLQQTSAEQPLNTTEDIERLIESDGVQLLYFSKPDCQVCKTLKPKVQHLLQHKFQQIKFHYINLEHIPAAASKFSVYTVPVILVFYQGKEMFRKARYLGLYELESALNRFVSLHFD